LRFGEKTFAAGFIDGRLAAVDDGDGEISLPRRNGGGKTGRSAANNDNVRIRHCTSISFQGETEEEIRERARECDKNSVTIQFW
jgi:hypothetical protein